MVKGPEHLSYREWLRVLGLLILEKAWEGSFQYSINTRWKEDNRIWLFSVFCHRTSTSRHKHKKFHLNIKNYIFIVRVGQHGDQLPSCGVIILRDTQNLLGTILVICCGWLCLKGKVGLEYIQRSLWTSIVLWFCDQELCRHG